MRAGRIVPELELRPIMTRAVFAALYLCFILQQIAFAEKTPTSDSVVEGEAQFPMVADDTRFFHNFTAERTGPPVKIRLLDADQYSRIFYSSREGSITSELMEEIEQGEEVLDIGAETGVFSLTAALKGASVTAIEYDPELAKSLTESTELNGVKDRVLVLTWLASSTQGYATVFAKAERGCVYSGLHTVNMSTDEYKRGIITAPTRSVDQAIREGHFPRPSVVRISAEGAEQFVLEGMEELLRLPEGEAPRAVLLVIYPYQLKRTLEWMSARGYRTDPPEDLPEDADFLAWEEGAVDWSSAGLLEWYKQRVFGFFGAQVAGRGIAGDAFVFRKVGAGAFTGAFRPAAPRTCRAPPAPAPPAAPRARSAAESGSWRVQWRGAAFSPPAFAPAPAAPPPGPPSAPSGGLDGAAECAEEGAAEGAEGEGGAGAEEEELSEAPLTLVTAASKDYFDRLANLVGSAHVAEPDLPIAVFVAPLPLPAAPLLDPATPAADAAAEARRVTGSVGGEQDMGMTREQRREALSWDNVELHRYPFDKYPPHVRTLANYAWKMPLVLEAARSLTNILAREPGLVTAERGLGRYLDAGIEIRGPVDELRTMLAARGYFFTTQGCNLSDEPDVPCDPQEACTVGDKTPPGVIQELFGVPDEQYPHLFKPCIAGGLLGVNTDTVGGRRMMAKVLQPAVECSERLGCIYPPQAVAIVNSNFDMAPLGLLVHAGRFSFQPERRFNAALFSALHTSELAVQDAGVILYTRRKFKGLDYLPFKEHLRVDPSRAAAAASDAEPLVKTYSRGETGLLYATPESVSRADAAAAAPPVMPMTYAPLPAASPSQSSAPAAASGKAPAQRRQRPAAGEVYVSIVLSARNDGHEGNFVTRLQACLDQLSAAARIHPALSAEVLLVEWDPPANRPPISRALSWPPHLPPTRIIRVPHEVHAALPQAAKDGFPQFYAKNVGLRRARGRFVLVINGDILLGEVLVGMLARRELAEDALYRIDRHDLLERFRPSLRGEGDMTAAAEGALKKVMTMQRLAVGDLLSEVGLEWEALGELHRTTHGHLRITFPDDVTVRTQYWDAVKLLGRGPVVEFPVPLAEDEAVADKANQHLVVPLNYTQHRPGSPAQMPELHTYADGDFFLAPKTAVETVRGYPELPLPVLVDSFLTVAVSAAGYRQMVFMPPACVFHQYHPQGTMPQRVAETVGQAEIDGFVKNVTQMLAEQEPIIINGKNWGYGDVEFEEEQV